MPDLPPGPELDAAVAREVMGWWQAEPQDVEAKKWKLRGLTAWGDEGLASLRFIGPPDLDKGPGSGFWSPSTDIAAAWEVVERLYEQEIELAGLSRQRRCGKNLDRLGEYGCRLDIPQHLWRDRFGPSGVHEFSPTAPHAICLAALAAVRGKK